MVNSVYATKYRNQRVVKMMVIVINSPVLTNHSITGISCTFEKNRLFELD